MRVPPVVFSIGAIVERVYEPVCPCFRTVAAQLEEFSEAPLAPLAAACNANEKRGQKLRTALAFGWPVSGIMRQRRAIHDMPR